MMEGIKKKVITGWGERKYFGAERIKKTSEEPTHPVKRAPVRRQQKRHSGGGGLCGADMSADIGDQVPI